MMIPNEAFLKYFPDATLSGMEDRADRSSCLRIGTYAVIHKIIIKPAHTLLIKEVH